MVLTNSIKEKVIKRQKSKSKRCEKKLGSPVWFYHKIGASYKSISGDSSDNQENIVGLCQECHSVLKEREKMKKQFDTSGDGVHLIG